ncbi:MAG: VWA domain-containing protein, partial [Pyrinomonadaceae bacterium]|nr:VWA domain-containing protein [Pyrinomonadaceae bacterium]
MRRINAVSLLLSLLLFAAASASAQTRPRRVGNTTSASQQQPASTTNTGTTNTTTTAPRRPPVLTGNTTSKYPSTTQQQPAPPASNEPEEVGDGDVVRVNTSLVTVPVSVMDRSGRYIPNLQQRDFRIFEDGVEQQVAYFASVEKPFTVALVIDTSESTRFKMEEIQDAAIAFINQLRSDDRVLVVSFGDDVRVLAEATSDRYTLRDAVRRTRTGGSTRLYDAVDFVINQRLNRIDGRKAVVLFTDGVDTTSRRASYQSNIRDAEELDALIYPVQYDTYVDMNGGGRGGGTWPGPSPMPRRRRSSGSILADILADVLGGPSVTIGGGGGGGSNTGGGPGSSRSDYDRADAYLNDLADKTGARLYRADDLRNLTQSFAYIAEELRRQYSLGYYPKRPARGRKARNQSEGGQARSGRARKRRLRLQRRKWRRGFALN